MKIRLFPFVIAIFFPLFIGNLSAFFTQENIKLFAEINKPYLSPPAWIFPIVWTVLFLLMGLASYIIFSNDSDIPKRNHAITFYALQLFINFFWSIIFFNLHMYLLAFVWLVLLWCMIIVTIFYFWQISRQAAYFMIPYLLWVTFAGYLNLAIYILN